MYPQYAAKDLTLAKRGGEHKIQDLNWVILSKYKDMIKETHIKIISDGWHVNNYCKVIYRYVIVVKHWDKENQ